MRKSHTVKIICCAGALLAMAAFTLKLSLLQTQPKAKNNTNFAKIVDKAIKAGVKCNESGISLTSDDKQYLLNAAHTVLKNHFSDSPKQMTENNFDNAPQNISSQSAKLFVTLLTDGKIRGCRSAKKGSLLKNTISAAYRAIDDERFGGKHKKEELPNTTVDITILLKPTSVKGHKIKEIKKQIELGIHAISLKNGKKRAFFKSSVPISHGYSLKTTLQRLGKKAKIGSDAYKKSDTKIYQYNAVQFCERFADKSLAELYRSNLLLYQADVSRGAFLEALRLCGDYMKNHVGADGLMTYDYDTYRDKKDNPVTGSSVIRRLASTWMLASIGNYFNDVRYKDAARRSIDYCLDNFYIYDTQRDFGYLKVGEDANLALAAFMLCCLLEIDDEQYHAEEKKHLISFILAMEDKNKGFLYPVYLPNRQTNFKRKEVYYPGEALTVIMSLYEATRNPEYLAVTERVFDYYRNLYERCSKKASMSPWMSKAYAKAFFATGNRRYADFVLKMNDYVLTFQRDIDQEYIDKIGSFFSKGASYSTAVMVESLAEAYRVARALNDTKRMQAYRKGVLMGNRFILQCQYTEDNMFTAKNRRLTLGGIRTTIYGNTVRIDSNQHGACALLKTLEYIYDN